MDDTARWLYNGFKSCLDTYPVKDVIDRYVSYAAATNATSQVTIMRSTSARVY